jgi:hypothetical protein
MSLVRLNLRNLTLFEDEELAADWGGADHDQ